ncbi:Thiamine-monophosphate kinase [Thalassoglobus neptunius]|uniref:Thiamine-monophosphate kinase n=1 Tax=Thalassoglobus neptunius TaxID=1938619 RepID=A0A5C5VU34_9PLAN|nr:thiamine-phosphate kinase [Thalassoglobus neptunius]TWT41653.1 Thiamine-monophosphate kinase [Thalassoglobus neptunius]
MSDSSKSSNRPEFDLIDWIAQQLTSSHGLQLGIGDDAAILSQERGWEWVTAVDCLVGGTHFLNDTPLELVGRKSLAVNLSDVAAMGAVPVSALIGLVIPKSMKRSDVERLCMGIIELAKTWNVSIAGGDTNSCDGPLMISVTVFGRVETGTAVLRSGAQVGDALFVTGRLGGSLKSGRHLSFSPRISEARELLANSRPTAMLDLSDGLAGDLLHVSRRSGVGFVIEAERVPIHDDVDHSLPFEKRLAHALTDGEDFELLFTVNSEAAEKLERSGELLGTPVTRVGSCVPGSQIQIQLGGELSPLSPGGWVHHLD